MLETFPQVFCFPKSRINEDGGNLTFSRKDLIEAKRERERQRARLELTGKEVAKINAKEQGRA